MKRVNFEINLAALCCNIMEMILCAGDNLFVVPNEIYNQAKQAKQKALDRKLISKEKDVNNVSATRISVFVHTIRERIV